jgi:hypothetical protein
MNIQSIIRADDSLQWHRHIEKSTYCSARDDHTDKNPMRRLDEQATK